VSEFIITEPGAYADISMDDYHGREICGSPSVSSSGLKRIEDESAYHYWFNSPLNPNRPKQEQKRHFNVGKGLHDLLLMGDLFPKEYFILPEGFDARLKDYRSAKEERDAAIEAGVPVIRFDDNEMIKAMAIQVRSDPIAEALISSGQPEMTLAAKDPVTGVWMRARPDVLPDTKDIIPDIKTAISAHPAAYEKQATNFGYFQSAAHYMDLIDLLYGEAEQKRRFVLIVVEKSPPYVVQTYHLDDEAIQFGRMLNRRCINIFARCLETGDWPGYAPRESPILPLHMSPWAISTINRRIDAGELSWEN
jgi:PDDEXK-like domain of unknown function (DUF3799)